MTGRTILTDIDDTCLNFGDRFQAHAEARGYATRGRLRDVWRIEDCLDIPVEAVIPHLVAFTSDPAVRHEPEPCAAAVLPQLRAFGYRFIGISACGTDPAYRARRIANLTAAFGFAFDDVVCVPFGGSKAEALGRFAPAIWVEDHLGHARAGAQSGHRTFLLDRPYNRTGEEGEAESGIERVATWWDILARLEPTRWADPEGANRDRGAFLP